MDKLETFKKLTGIKINIDKPPVETIQKETSYNFDNSVYYCEQYYKTNKIPGVNLNSWVSVYNLLTGVGIV
jgi:hypothetical protein